MGKDPRLPLGNQLSFPANWSKALWSISVFTAFLNGSSASSPILIIGCVQLSGLLGSHCVAFHKIERQSSAIAEGNAFSILVKPSLMKLFICAGDNCSIV